nr:MAG TPA: hypothetical protein [Caudoviricetes sp.]
MAFGKLASICTFYSRVSARVSIRGRSNLRPREYNACASIYCTMSRTIFTMSSILAVSEAFKTNSF